MQTSSSTKRDLLVWQIRPMPTSILTNSCRQSMSSPHLYLTFVPGYDACAYLVMLACCLKAPSQLTRLGCLMLQLVLVFNCSPVMLLQQARTASVHACFCLVAESVQKQRHLVFKPAPAQFLKLYRSQDKRCSSLLLLNRVT